MTYYDDSVLGDTEYETCSLCVRVVKDADLVETDSGRLCPDCRWDEYERQQNEREYTQRFGTFGGANGPARPY